MVSPTKSGRIVERRDQVLIGRFSFAARAAPTFFTRWWSTKGPFLTERPMVLALVSFLVPELDDHAACALVLARLVALGQHPPGAYGILPCRGLSLTAAVRVVDRIHRDAAHGGPHAAPADASGLADRFEAVLLVADLADRRAAIDVHLAYFPRTQPDLCVAAFSCKELHGRARGARQLGTSARLHFDAMNRRSDGDILERERITRFDRRLRPRHELRAGRETLGRDDVAALAVRVAEQREVRAPVRIVF